jgi:hypothetical protein
VVTLMVVKARSNVSVSILAGVRTGGAGGSDKYSGVQNCRCAESSKWRRQIDYCIVGLSENYPAEREGSLL